MADGTINIQTTVQINGDEAIKDAKQIQKEVQKALEFKTNDDAIKDTIKDLKILSKENDKLSAKLRAYKKPVKTEPYRNLEAGIAAREAELKAKQKEIKSADTALKNLKSEIDTKQASIEAKLSGTHWRAFQEQIPKLLKDYDELQDKLSNLRAEEEHLQNAIYGRKGSIASLEKRGKAFQPGYEGKDAEDTYKKLLANNEQMRGYAGLVNATAEAEKKATAELERQKQIQEDQYTTIELFENKSEDSSKSSKKSITSWRDLGITITEAQKQVDKYTRAVYATAHPTDKAVESLEYWKNILHELQTTAKANSKIEPVSFESTIDPNQLSAQLRDLDATIVSIIKEYGDFYQIAQDVGKATNVEELDEARKKFIELENVVGKFQGPSSDYILVYGDAISDAIEEVERFRNLGVIPEDKAEIALNRLNQLAMAWSEMTTKVDEADSTFSSLFGSVDNELNITKSKILDLASKISEYETMRAEQIQLAPGADVSSATEHLQKLRTQLQQLIDTYEQLGGKADELNLFPTEEDAKESTKAVGEWNPIIANLRDELVNLQKNKAILEEQGFGVGHSAYDTVVARISEINSKLKEWEAINKQIGSGAETVAESYLSAPEHIQDMARRLDELLLKQQGVGLSISEKFEMGSITRKLQAYDRSLEENVVAEKESAKATNTNSSAKKKAEAITDKLASAHKRLDKTTNNLKKSFKKGLVFISKYFLGFRSLFFLVRKLRTSVKEGLQNLVQFKGGANETNKAITELQTSILFIKNAWAAAFAPVINYVMPVLTMLMDMFAKLGNAIGRFFATLTGQKTVIQAVKADVGSYADTLNGTAGSAGKAADATDKLNDRLAAFDDLNVLGVDKDDDNKGTGGGGGGKGDNLPNVDEMFTEIVPESSLADKIKEAFLSGDFTDLGSALSEKIRTGLENIDWGPIKTAAEKIGKGVATFINGFFDPTTFSAIGSTIAETLNTVSTAVNSFFDNVDVDNIAKSHTSLLAGFLETTDFSALGTTASNIVSALLNYVSTFITTFPYDGVVQALISFFSGIKWADVFTGAGKLVGSIAVGVSELANAITEPLAKLIVDNFTDNGELSWKSFKDGLKNAITGIASWLNENVFYPFAEGFCEAFGLDEGDGGLFGEGIDVIAGFLAGIVNKLNNIVSWVKKYVFDPIVNAVKDLFGINSPSTVFKEFGGFLIDGLVVGIQSGFRAIRTVFNGIKNLILGIFRTIKDKVVKVWQDVYDAVAPIINALFTVIETVFDVVRTAVNVVIEAINKLSWKIPSWVPGVGGKTFGFDVDLIPEIDMPKLAQGAVIPPNHEFMAILGDQKQGTNIEAPLDTIVDAFRQVVGNINVQNTGNQVLQVDGQTFARLMTPYVVSELGRRGYNVKLLEG